MASNDYFMRQMEGFADMLSTMLLGEKASDTAETIYDSQTSTEGHSLLIDLRFLVMQGQLNAAENLLFEQMEEDKGSCYLEVSRQFYEWLDQLDDEALEKSGYSRSEIDEGRTAVQRFYGN